MGGNRLMFGCGMIFGALVCVCVWNASHNPFIQEKAFPSMDFRIDTSRVLMNQDMDEKKCPDIFQRCKNCTNHATAAFFALSKAFLSFTLIASHRAANPCVMPGKY